MTHARSFVLALFTIAIAACGETGGAGGSGGTGGSGGSGGDAGVGGGESGTRFPCTEAGIRAAIAAGGGPNTFLCDGPTAITTAAALQIDDDVILDGEGNLTVDADGDHRVFIVGNPGVIRLDDPVTVELRNMTITGGFAELPEVGGGGVLSAGELTVVNCTITNNTAPGGSGIDSFGALTVQGSTISGNDGWYAINHQGWEMTIEDSTISNNAGGGLAVSSLRGLVDNTTISGNSSDLEEGGGIWNLAHLFVSGSVISGNQAVRGGGIWNAGDFTLYASTVSGNSAGDGGGVYNADPYRPDGPVSDIGLMSIEFSTLSGNTAERGGGIYTAGLWQRITNSTVSGNTADTGGGIAMAGTKEGPSSFTVANTTVAANTAPEGSAVWAVGNSPELRFIGTIIDGSCQAAAGTVTWVSNGSNVESPGDTCNLSQSSDQTGVAPGALMLGPLQDNGGLSGTHTHAPDPASVAVDAMLAEDCMLSLSEPRQDQRFVNRPVGAACDVGSVEVE